MIGEILNKTRKAKGLTAQQMADYLNINLRSYRAYESNDRQPSLEILIKIAGNLAVTTDYLLGRVYMMDCFDSYFNNIHFVVNDINTDDSSFVFILESPHTNELKEGYPLAGESGIDAANFLGLTDSNYKNLAGVSLGEIAKKNNCGINIINICRVPLKLTTKAKAYYQNYENSTEYLECIKSLTRIKNGFESFGNHNESYLNDIEEQILTCFATRLSSIAPNDSVTNIIVCGKFAEKYYKKPSLKCRMPKGCYRTFIVPHPSRDLWETNKNHAHLNQVKQLLNAHIKQIGIT